MGITTMRTRTHTAPPGSAHRSSAVPGRPPARGQKHSGFSVRLQIDNHCGQTRRRSGRYLPDGHRRADLVHRAAWAARAEASSYYDEESAGPAGVRFVLKGAVVTGPEAGHNVAEMVGAALAHLPSLHCARASAQPLIGAHLQWLFAQRRLWRGVPDRSQRRGAVSNHLGLLRFDVPRSALDGDHQGCQCSRRRKGPERSGAAATHDHASPDFHMAMTGEH